MAQMAAILIAALSVSAVILIIVWPVKVSDKDAVVKIPKGAGLSEISTQLKDSGLIRNRGLFVLYVWAVNADRKIQAGKYSFPQPITMPQIVYMMSHGRALPDDISVFIPEGFNVWEIDGRLSELGFTVKGEFARQLLIREGYLFPDTYSMPAEMAAFPEKTKTSADITDAVNRDYFIKNIAGKLESNFDSKTAEAFKNLSDKKKREAVIVASLLEKEARSENDMKIIAGIIYKRLSRNMFLQLDASVSYGACLRKFKDSKIPTCDVSQIGVAREIKIDSPYNTYTRRGLPSGPISNPGIKSISAALNPSESPYLYYLSTRDGSQIIFSKTGIEHLANRRKYL
ncbi:MAG: Aminodeoxychorismate lyase, partial [Candidatus Gottesmanbacteria bacterium GW2011_GWB1_44_11c]